MFNNLRKLPSVPKQQIDMFERISSIANRYVHYPVRFESLAFIFSLVGGVGFVLMMEYIKSTGQSLSFYLMLLVPMAVLLATTFLFLSVNWSLKRLFPRKKAMKDQLLAELEKYKPVDQGAYETFLKKIKEEELEGTDLSEWVTAEKKPLSIFIGLRNLNGNKQAAPVSRMQLRPLNEHR